ncbi:Asp-tRNA(Asn)/Glu-tRNA(Gln) amidotransferase subunit GatB [Caproiciproducens sp. R1]|uniref:Asp-tRNA(Asn)/Glu-tRNA(Gln) amidotransferase subunit GatB n=1 Tax=Caproiciproducens sp. R1 TaxID=3435000 RepID=UPI0040337C73
MSNYELVCGLETHIELSTKTKIFCSCTTEFGGDPNTHCCPVCIGLPGTLPKLNKKVVEYAVMAGLATNCEISPVSKMDRKNYVYPDLPKAYQISQYDMPLCKNGYVELSNGRKVRILRIHIEEDAGKLVHQRGSTYVDYNRGGVPLIEIVTEPDIRSIDEAREYLERLQLVMRFLGISDCKMQEGSMRCDVNVSVRPQGTEAFGTRTEIKNMNSFAHMAKAMEYEVNRQIDLLQSGEKVVQETRRYNEEDDCTESMRGKEDAHDYRYFREPDLMTIQVSEETVAQLREKLPELPHQRLERYRAEFGIPEADAQQLIKYRRIAEYFEAAIDGVQNPKVIANCMIGQMFSRLDGDSAKESFQVNVTPENLNALVKLLDAGKIKMNLLKATLEKMLDTGKAPGELISEADMGGVDADALKSVCEQAIASNPNAVSDYLSGKEKALKAILGSVMKATRGRADATEAEKLLIQLIQDTNTK